MIDIKFLRENPEVVKENIRKKLLSKQKISRKISLLLLHGLLLLFVIKMEMVFGVIR